MNTGVKKAAILGAGGIAETHAEILKKIPGVQLTAVCDVVPGKAEVFGRKLGIPEAYTTLQDLLSKGRPDVVHITTPPTAHASNAIDCLNANVNVFVEKPFCLNSEECAAVARAASASSATIGVNHNMTYHPAVLDVIREARSRRLGALNHASVSFSVPMPVFTGPYSHFMFRDTRNLMFELAIHPLSAIERLMGPVVACSTQPSGKIILPSGVQFFHTWQLAMECERGTASLFLSLGGDFLDTSILVVGEDATAFADLRRNIVRISDKSHLMRPNDDLRDSLQGAATLIGKSLRNYKDYILSSLGKRAPFPANFASMRNSIEGYYAALNAGVAPRAGIEQGISAVRACEMALAPVLQNAPAAMKTV